VTGSGKAASTWGRFNPRNFFPSTMFFLIGSLGAKNYSLFLRIVIRLSRSSCTLAEKKGSGINYVCLRWTRSPSECELNTSSFHHETGVYNWSVLEH
jgi:hypothetical protein